jgi:glycosyltransferase involved in cell wall biosynthesis
MTNADDVLVSVGVPVYNGAAELRRALETLVNQTHRNLEIVISDNASTDSTPEICREFAKRDARVVYLRNEKNLGGGPNFKRVVDESHGDYFMWAAHDDWWAPRFVEENLRVLLARPDYIASMSRVVYMDGTREVSMPFIERADWRALTGSTAANLRHYVANSGMNSRFYGLYHREVLRKCLPFEGYIACDNALIARTLAFGKHGEVNKPLFFRGMGGESARHLAMLTADKTFPGRILPLWRYTTKIWAMPHAKRDVGLVISLITVNTVFLGFLLLTLAKHAANRLIGGRAE